MCAQRELQTNISTHRHHSRSLLLFGVLGGFLRVRVVDDSDDDDNDVGRCVTDNRLQTRQRTEPAKGTFVQSNKIQYRTNNINGNINKTKAGAYSSNSIQKINFKK